MHIPKTRIPLPSPRAIDEAAARLPLSRDWPRVKLLVIPDIPGMRPSALPFEPVWTPMRGRRHDRNARGVFIGAGTGGRSPVAEVASVATASWTDLRWMLAATMCRECFDTQGAIREANRLLHMATTLPNGTLVTVTADGGIAPASSSSRISVL